jgi:hydroxymethylbilane synthase
MSRPLRVATRGSRLARWQAARVIDRLAVPCEIVVVSTTGDQRRDVPLWEIGGTGVFVKEVEEAVLDGRADLAVHSAKDLPSTTGAGLVLAAVPEREDPRDALAGATLANLPTAARVGTGSVRRRSQLAALRPDLTFGSLRGNIETRLDRVAEFDAVVVAYAALVRLGLVDRVAEVLDPAVLLPQVAQGALAVECRAGDDATAAVVARIDDPIAHVAVAAERAFLRELGGGCDVPCGALARVASDGTITLDALLSSPDGRVVLRTTASGHDADDVGRAAAHALLDEQGGRSVLDVTGTPLP